MSPRLPSVVPSGGRVRPITRWGTPILHRQLQTVVSYDTELSALVADMAVTMEAAGGNGLAANQIGVDLKAFVYEDWDLDDPDRKGMVVRAVCNAVVEDVGERDEGEVGSHEQMPDSTEGCLSLPGVMATCSRSQSIVVRGTDHKGATVEIHATGPLATTLQHEIDHLNGIVYGDRVPPDVRDGLNKRHEDLADRFPDDWPVSPAKQQDGWVLLDPVVQTQVPPQQ